MKLEDFDYKLPEDLIAQTPMTQRDECRLMVLDRESNIVEHRYFYDIIDYVNPGDCLVLNDSRVIPARIYGIKESTGAHIELLLIKRIEEDKWECMIRPGKRIKEGDRIIFAGHTLSLPAGIDPNDYPDGYKINATDKFFVAVALGICDPEQGTRVMEFSYEGIFMERLEEIGSMPLPPYITRSANDKDKEMYQTVYSRIDGSVAAPTAGLHFTKELLKKAADKGVKIAYVTLHVGIGTFRPVKVEKIEDHKMHFEECSISEDNARIINDTIESGGRIISVGTTSTRTLESMAGMPFQAFKSNKNNNLNVESDICVRKNFRVKAGETSTGIFIYPGYEFKIVDALITNFHLPKSTLIMLVSALYDREHILEAYEEAVKERYRFFSYGDAMLII